MSIASDKALNLGGAKILYDDLRGRIDGKDVTGPLAPSDTETATAAHAVGEVISVGGQLYVVTAAIAVGDTIASGTNVTPSTLAEVLALYATVANPVFEGSISLGRKADTTIGTESVAEGHSATASGAYSHAEGRQTTASGSNAHTEGGMTTASGMNAHAEGASTTASGTCAHSEGTSTTASGSNSHAEGTFTIANHSCQHVFGQYNKEDESTAGSSAKGTYIEIVGNGTATTSIKRSNARTLDWNGNESLAGSLTLGMGTANEVTITATQLQALLATLS